MVLKVGSKYILRFSINDHELVYTAVVLSDDGKHISFKDKFDKELEYSREFFLTAEEVLDR